MWTKAEGEWPCNRIIFLLTLKGKYNVCTVCSREISLTEIYFDLRKANRFMDKIILSSLSYNARHSNGSLASKATTRKQNLLVEGWTERENKIEQNDQNPKIRFVGSNVCVCVSLSLCASVLLLILITVWLMSFWNGSHFFGHSLSDDLISSSRSISLFERVNYRIEEIFISQSVENIHQKTERKHLNLP